MGLSNTFRVAVYDEFLDSFAKLPRAQQKKVNKFVRKFRSDPTNPSINYERISTFKDPNLRTVRVDQAYRAIVLKPDKGNIYVLLWVDHHDDAMDWAAKKRFVIHPETGSLQVLTNVAVDDKLESVPPPPSVKQYPLFGQFSDDDLVSLGVPVEQLPEVRKIITADQLDALVSVFPPEAYEALFFLADGEPLEAVRQAMAVEVPEKVDTEDFAAALDNASTKRRFVVVTDDQDLEAILDAPLDKWRVFLHPSQRKLVAAHFNGPARVLGGAGTGKTVVAMHRARYLATEVFKDDGDRILFTTFTNNLARDIHQSLRKLCSPEALRRIEVVHLDKWVSDFLLGQGYDYKIQYWPNKKILEPLWEQALGSGSSEFSAQFYREEFEYVVQPAGCASYEDYRQASRAGRGVRLSRAQRKAIWPVFEEYRNLLEEKGFRESIDAMRDAANLLNEGRGKPLYSAIVVDEAQDMSTVAFQLLRSIIPVERANDLFIVGDGHQRIYRRKVTLSRAGVNVVGRSRKLYINYRTTDEIRRYAVALLQAVDVDDLDGGHDNNSRYKSLVHGKPPTISTPESFREEVDVIQEFVEAEDPSQTCLVARTSRLLEQYEAALGERGIKTRRLRRSEPDDLSEPGLRLATMHRVKGLEFDRLVVAGVKEGSVPLNWGEMRSDDKAVREEAEMRERALFYVATTRARRDVLITSHGKPSPWLATAGS